jgi:hypothetical protein
VSGGAFTHSPGGGAVPKLFQQQALSPPSGQVSPLPQGMPLLDDEVVVLLLDDEDDVVVLLLDDEVVVPVPDDVLVVLLELLVNAAPPAPPVPAPSWKSELKSPAPQPMTEAMARVSEPNASV